MNRSYFSLLVALLIHILFLILFWFLGSIAPDIKKPIQEKEKRIKISLKEMPKTKKMGKVQQKPVETLQAPPLPKGSQLKKLVTKKPVKYEPKKPIKKPKLNPKPKPKVPKPTPKPQPKVEPLPPEKPYIPLIDEKKKKKVVKKDKDDPMAWLNEDKSDEEEEVVTKNDSRLGAGGSVREMKELYGDTWGKLTPGQQQYMLDNQEVMRRITQQVLNRQARVSQFINNINANRVNIIEFYLHPNGDMSDFHFIQKSGYFELDDITKATIEYAYSKYPRPNEKILVRYNVFYNLLRR